jgi:Ankyrin repeats (3 copies)
MAMAMDMEQYYSDYSSDGEYWEDDEPAADSVLLSMVQSYDWNGAIARIKEYPAECRAVGVQGRTPLHVACDHDAPALVIEALMKAYPEASLSVGTSNMNPLHITCSSHRASADIVRILLETSSLGKQMSSMRDVDGDTPLHAACRCGAPIEVLKLLLTSDPDAVHERDYEGLTPLLRLWVRYFVILGDNFVDNVDGPHDLNGDLGDAWRKTELLLRCAYLGSVNLDSSSSKVFRPMHAAAAIDCPRPVVRLATIIHKEHLAQRDENGNTPLLIAASTPVYKVRDLSDDGYMLEDRIHGDDKDEEMAYEEDADTSQPSVIEILMDALPGAAAICDLKGNLALNLAIASGKRWHQGVQAILAGYPDALNREDSSNGFIPFLQASVIQRPDTGTIFELLRRDPALLRNWTLDGIEGDLADDADGDMVIK